MSGIKQKIAVRPRSYANDSAIITMCCYCKRIKVEKDWEQIDIEDHGNISHGYCPVCFGIYCLPEIKSRMGISADMAASNCMSAVAP
jgi:hypothetical protein